VAAVAAEAVARTNATESTIFELVNMTCFRCAVGIFLTVYENKPGNESRKISVNRQ
jgi:hypothetical protein